MKTLLRRGLLFALLLLACTSRVPGPGQSVPDGDALGTLIDLLHQAPPEQDQTMGYLEDHTELLDRLCSGAIKVSPSDSLEVLIAGLDDVLQLEGMLRSDNKRLDPVSAIVFRETLFRTIIGTQQEMQKAFNRGETHESMHFDVRVSLTIPYLQANQRFSRAKTRLLTDVIAMLPELKMWGDRQRCWEAIDRMTREIDIKKSESGYDTFQRSAHGIYAKPGEMMSLLDKGLEREKDPELSRYASAIVQGIRESMVAEPDPEFQARVKEASDLQRQFREDRTGRKAGLTPENAVTAADWFQLGYEALDNRTKVEYYGKSLQLDAANPAALNNLGNARQALGEYDAAIRDYSSAINLDPKYAPAFLNRGNCYSAEKKYENAVADYDSAIVLDPRNPSGYRFRGAACSALGRYGQAVEDYTHAIHDNMMDTTLYLLRGDMYRLMEAYPEAIMDYSSAIELDSLCAMAWHNRGLCRKQTGEIDLAIGDYRHAIALQPDNSAAWYNLGTCYWQLRDWDEVITAWEKCLEIDPDHANAQVWLPRAREAARPKTIKVKRVKRTVREVE